MLAALAPERLSAIVAIALPYQPRGIYRRIVLDGVGQFSHREAADEVSRAIQSHLGG
ncbi:MAG: hypothetical protein JO206_05355 [Solirubrobacterales bacterium]|nr:hypothetical protein [Solirubrobacterales bacterium]